MIYNQQNEEMRLGICVDVLVADYKKFILREYEYDASIVYGYELLFQFYLTEQEQAKLYQWKHGDVEQ